MHQTGVTIKSQKNNSTALGINQQKRTHMQRTTSTRTAHGQRFSTALSKHQNNLPTYQDLDPEGDRIFSESTPPERHERSSRGDLQLQQI